LNTPAMRSRKPMVLLARLPLIEQPREKG